MVKETMEKVWGEMWDAGGQWKKVSGKEIKRTEGGEGMTHTGPVACMRVPICVCVRAYKRSRIHCHAHASATV